MSLHAALRYSSPLVATLFATACWIPVTKAGPSGAKSAAMIDRGAAATSVPPDNPLLRPWTGPYGGVPAFDKVAVADFEPALEAAMNANLAEIDKIATSSAPATFANTVKAMERAGRPLQRVTAVYGVWSSTMNSPEFQAVERKMAPRLAAFSDKITQNAALFRRIEAIYNAPDKATTLTP